jgi:hypothetical protein
MAASQPMPTWGWVCLFVPCLAAPLNLHSVSVPWEFWATELLPLAKEEGWEPGGVRCCRLHIYCSVSHCSVLYCWALKFLLRWLRQL